MSLVFESPWKGGSVLGATSVRLDNKNAEEAIRVKSNQKAFCDRFEQQFDQAFIYFSSLANGDVTSDQDIENKSRVEGNKSRVMNPRQSITIPMGKVIAAEVDFSRYIHRRFSKKEAERMVTLFKTILPSERARFVRNVAEFIYCKYENQIDHLMMRPQGSMIPGAVEQFSDCVVVRMMGVLLGDNEVTRNTNLFVDIIRKVSAFSARDPLFFKQNMEQKLYSFFILGIIQVVSDYPKDKLRLQTTPALTLTDDWTAEGIFKNTGVLVEQNGQPSVRYAAVNVQVNNYGYCRGGLEEALARNLSSGPQKDYSWGEGRKWLNPGESSPMLVAYADKKGDAENRVVQHQNLKTPNVVAASGVS